MTQIAPWKSAPHPFFWIYPWLQCLSALVRALHQIPSIFRAISFYRIKAKNFCVTVSENVIKFHWIPTFFCNLLYSVHSLSNLQGLYQLQRSTNAGRFLRLSFYFSHSWIPGRQLFAITVFIICPPICFSPFSLLKYWLIWERRFCSKIHDKRKTGLGTKHGFSPSLKPELLLFPQDKMIGCGNLQWKPTTTCNGYHKSVIHLVFSSSTVKLI